MYCRTCGTGVESPNAACPGCGVWPRRGKAYCPSCGKVTPNPDQIMCVSCGCSLRDTSGTPTDTADVLFRVAGVCMLLSGLMNVLWALMLTLGLILMCVGVFWLIPMLVAVMYAGVGIVLAATGKQYRILVFTPVLGLMVSAVNFNVMGGMLDMVALVLGIIAFTQSRPDEEEG